MPQPPAEMAQRRGGTGVAVSRAPWSTRHGVVAPCRAVHELCSQCRGCSLGHHLWLRIRGEI